MIPQFLCSKEEQSGDLVKILPDWTSGTALNIFFVYPPQRFLSPKIQAFMRLALNSVKIGV